VCPCILKPKDLCSLLVCGHFFNIFWPPYLKQINGAESTEANVCSSCQQNLRNALELRGTLNFITVFLTVGLYTVCIFNVTSRALASDWNFANNIKEENFILSSKMVGTHQKRAGKQNYSTCLFRCRTAKSKNGNLRDWLEFDDISGH
jgi:hypothetical protein